MNTKTTEEIIIKKLKERNISKVYLYFPQIKFEGLDELKSSLPKEFEVFEALKKSPYEKDEAILSFGTQYGCPILDKVEADNILIVGISAHNRTIGSVQWNKPQKILRVFPMKGVFSLSEAEQKKYFQKIADQFRQDAVGQNSSKNDKITCSMQRPFDPVANATDLIVKYHGKQKRKAGGQLFIIHLLEVSNLIRKGFPNEATQELLAAGLCHDLLEDTKCPENEILKTCGDKVLEIVKNVSNDQNLSWESKKKDYIQKVSEGGREAQIVSLCDKVANMRSLLEVYKIEKEEIWKYFNRGRDKKIWFEEACYEMLLAKLRSHPYLDLYAEQIEILNNPYENGLFDNPYITFKSGLPDENGQEEECYEVWLKNPDQVTYEVQMETGGSISFDEELVMIDSKGAVNLGSIDPDGDLLLESGHIYGISDSTVWFRVWLSDLKDRAKLIKFSIDKGYFNSEKVEVTEQENR